MYLLCTRHVFTMMHCVITYRESKTLLTLGLSVLTNSTVNRTRSAELVHHFQLFLDLVDDAPGGGSVSSELQTIQVSTGPGLLAAGCRLLAHTLQLVL